MADQENRSGVAILVKAPQKAARAVRVNVTVPEDELERIDRFAEANGYTRSGFLLRAARREMETTWGDLAAEINAKLSAGEGVAKQGMEKFIAGEGVAKLEAVLASHPAKPLAEDRAFSRLNLPLPPHTPEGHRQTAEFRAKARQDRQDE